MSGPVDPSAAAAESSLGRDDIRLLLRADDAPEVAVDALAAVVRMPLDAGAWRWVGEYALFVVLDGDGSMLEADPDRVLGSLARIPVRQVRDRLHALLEEGSPWRRQAAVALASIGDTEASPALADLLIRHPDDLDAAMAAAGIGFGADAARVGRAALPGGDLDRRFWVSLGVAHDGDPAPVRSVLAELAAGDGLHSLETVHPDPMEQDRILRRIAPLAPAVVEYLESVPPAADRPWSPEGPSADERLAELAWVLLSAHHDVVDRPEVATSWEPPVPEPYDGDPVVLADEVIAGVATGLRFGSGVGYEEPDPDRVQAFWDRDVDLRAAFPELPPEVTTRLVEALLQASAPESIDIGNLLVDLVSTSPERFEPDVPVLFEQYARCRDEPAGRWLAYQVAWLVSRAPLDEVLAGLGPVLDGDAASHRRYAVNLVEDVARYRNHRYGPIFGGGAEPTDVAVAPGDQLLDIDVPRAAAVAEPTAEPRPRRALDARRLGADLFVGDQESPSAFVVGVENVVRISIGRSAAILADEAFPPVAAEDETGEVVLPVWVLVGGEVLPGTITLPIDARLDSTDDFDVRFVPPPVDEMVLQIVVFRPDGNDVLQAAELRGPVVASIGDQLPTPGSITLTVVSVQDLVHPAPSPATGTIVHSPSGVMLKTGEAPIPVGTEAVRRWIDSTVNDINKVAKAAESLGGSVDDLLVALAGRGANRLADLPGLRALAGTDRIQVVSLDAREVIPLGLLYSGPLPDEATARLCNGWATAGAVETGRCPSCGDGGPADGSTVCPLQFWALSKIIEHHGPRPGAGSGTTFTALALRTLSHDTLDTAGPVVLGVSAKVLEVAPAALDELEESLGNVYPAVEKATDWAAWTRLVGTTRPRVLVATPHQSVRLSFGEERNFLELGGEEVSAFDETYVTGSEPRITPIVVLLGCDTAVGQGQALVSLASLFRELGAAVVVSSLGEVIAAQAPGVVESLLGELATAIDTEATVGRALLRTRRALLKERKLLALLLMSHGDAEWKVAR